MESTSPSMNREREKWSNLYSKVQSPFSLRPTDMYIVGASKTGTTWMQQIVHQIRTGGDESFENIYDVIPVVWNKISNVDLNSDQPAEPRVFKTHDYYEGIPKLDGQTRFILTIRDPYDAAFSYIKFYWRRNGIEQDLSPDEYIDLVQMREPNMSASVTNFIDRWWPRIHDPNVLLMPYEFMKSGLESCVQKVSNFVLGKPMEEPALSKVLHFSSFKYMSSQKEKFDAHGFGQFMAEKVLCKNEKPEALIGMVRDDGGETGQGKELNPIVRDYIDKNWQGTVQKQFGFKDYNELLQQCAKL